MRRRVWPGRNRPNPIACGALTSCAGATSNWMTMPAAAWPTPWVVPPRRMLCQCHPAGVMTTSLASYRIRRMPGSAAPATAGGADCRRRIANAAETTQAVRVDVGADQADQVLDNVRAGVAGEVFNADRTEGASTLGEGCHYLMVPASVQ